MSFCVSDYLGIGTTSTLESWRIFWNSSKDTLIVGRARVAVSNAIILRLNSSASIF